MPGLEGLPRCFSVTPIFLLVEPVYFLIRPLREFAPDSAKYQ
jgi:hypothetical protein